MPMVKIRCIICEQYFHVWPYRLKQKVCYCSRKCKGVAMRGASPTNRAKLIGQKFGLLTVINEAGTKRGHAVWLCRCECGTLTRTTTGSLKSGGSKSCGCPWRRTGKDHPNWKGGFHITPDGYRELPIPNCKKAHRYRAEHRIVLERLLGRALKSEEVTHHRNGNKLDNRPENLIAMSRAEHASLHAEWRRTQRQSQ